MSSDNGRLMCAIQAWSDLQRVAVMGVCSVVRHASAPCLDKYRQVGLENALLCVASLIDIKSQGPSLPRMMTFVV